MRGLSLAQPTVDLSVTANTLLMSHVPSFQLSDFSWSICYIIVYVQLTKNVWVQGRRIANLLTKRAGVSPNNPQVLEATS